MSMRLLGTSALGKLLQIEKTKVCTILNYDIKWMQKLPTCSHLTFQCFTYVTKKRIEETMWKMLPKHIAKLNKMKAEVAERNSVKTTNSLYPKETKTLNKHILHRENVVSAVLLRELQEIVDSGKINEELTKLHVVFKSVILYGKLSATVTWESQGMPLDLHIYQTLMRYRADIRHTIIGSHVVGIIPVFKFAIDTFVEEQNKVKEIFSSKEFDMGAPDLGGDNLKSKEAESDEVEKSPKESCNDPTFKIFQVDVTNLHRKVQESKINLQEKNNKIINEIDFER